MSGKRDLYRYISFEDFINLVVNKKDRFVRPVCWDDKYESYIFSYIEKEGDIRRIVEDMYYNHWSKKYDVIVKNFLKMWHSKWFTYAQCWSIYPETDAMWRSYSYGNKSIRIRTTNEKLLIHAKKVFPEKECFEVYLRKVEYDLSDKSGIEQQIEEMKHSRSINETYFHKRPVFEHEGEYRLLIADNSLYDADDMASSGIISRLQEQIEGKSDEEIINKITQEIVKERADWDRLNNNIRIENIEDVNEFLEGVMVHPLAPAWYVDIIEQICNSTKIYFDKQSQIYNLQF